MKIYAKSIWWLSSITLISFCVLIFSNKIIYDISLAIFGSSLVTLIISIIGYRSERKKTLEHFYNTICKRISYLSTYLHSCSIEDKCKFFINHFYRDFPSIGDAYADIYFLWDYKKKNLKYIYDNIYSKCRDMAYDIDNYYFDFATYINKTGKNSQIIKEYIQMLESKYLNNKIENNFRVTIMNELNGEYYKILYGKEMESDSYE